MAKSENKVKEIKFDFYQCEVSGQNNTSVDEIFQDLLDKLNDSSTSIAKKIFNHTIKLTKLEKIEDGFRGVVCKFRTEELPHAGTIGGEERELTLNEDEHLIEKTFFKYFQDNSVLIMQRNGHAVSYSQFSNYLSSNNYTVSFNPIIKAADLKLLMSNTTNLKWAKLKIARPTNSDLFANTEHDFDNSIYQSLSASKAATVNMEFRGDGRSRDPEKRYLSSTLKRAFRELKNNFDVKQARLELEENGIVHPIDLISDRLMYSEEIELLGRYPNQQKMWDALMNAKTEKQHELDSYFGLQENRLM